MSLKSIGLILCALVLSGGGWLAGEKYKHEMRDLIFIKELVLHLKREISFSRTELPDCFLSFQNKNYSDVINCLSKGNYEEATKKLAFKNEFSQILISFWSSLGRDTACAEESRINKFLDFLEHEEEKMSSSLTGKIKSARVLGICLGAALLLLFI